MSWRLVERALATPYDKGHGYDFDLTRQHEIAARLRAPDISFARVAVRPDDGRLLGMADATHEEWNNTVGLHALFIDVGARGQGIGRRLFDLVTRYGRECGAQAVLVETQTNNVPAVRFYLRMGCRIAGIHDALYDRSLNETAVYLEYPLRGKT